MNLTHTHEFLITHITDSGTGFAVRTDNGESVHISPRLLQQAHANLDDICTGIIVQNAAEDQRERTPWVAAYVQERRAARDVLGLATDVPAEAVQAPTEEPEQVDWADVQRKILAMLQSADVTYCETADIADVVGVEPRKLSQHLENMHSRGEICRAHVNQRAGQQRATLVLWSINADVYKGSAQPATEPASSSCRVSSTHRTAMRGQRFAAQNVRTKTTSTGATRRRKSDD